MSHDGTAALGRQSCEIEQVRRVLFPRALRQPPAFVDLGVEDGAAAQERYSRPRQAKLDTARVLNQISNTR